METSDGADPRVPLSPREKRIAYPLAVAIALSFLGGAIVANATGSASYFWIGFGVAAALHIALTTWIARTHRLPFGPTFLLRDPTAGRPGPPRPAAKWALIGSGMMALFSVLVIATGQPTGTRLTYLAAGAVSGGILGFGLGDEYEDAGRTWKRFIQLAAVAFLALFIFGLAREALS